MKLYEIKGIAKSGRSGSVSTSDNNLKLEMGAPGTSSNIHNPEQLFASGYASCFSQAMFVVTERHGIKVESAPIEVTVELHKDDVKGFEIMVGVEATLNDVPAAKALEIMKDAHNTCPYSKMIKPSNLLFVKINGNNIL